MVKNLIALGIIVVYSTVVALVHYHLSKKKDNKLKK